MSQLTDRLERDLREIAAGAQPSPSAWKLIEARLGDGAEPEPALELGPARSRQKRPIWPAAAAAALVVIIGSVAVLTRDGDDHSSFAADLTSTFVSPSNGFSIRHPDGATVTPATEGGAFDVVDTGAAAVLKGTSTEALFLGVATDERGRTVSRDEQIDRYLSDDDAFPGGCDVPRSQQAQITIDGKPGRIAECPNRIEATVVAGEKLYVFTLSHERSDARVVFDAFVATIDLTPETAVHYPAMTTTFVSPTYGYSFKYLDRGGLAPATGRWDPADEQLDDIQLSDRFDAVETGLAAYFVAASTEIPDGVSIDEWYDEHVSPSGCGVPRSEQAEITIDGESGRIAECGNQLEATVVAGGRLYLFMLGHQRSDGRAFFDAWIATIDLTPETATVP